jgi:hypothetical protein
LLYYDRNPALNYYTTLLIRIFLWLFFIALSLLLSVDILLWLSMPVLPQILSRVGAVLLLVAFAFMVILGLGYVAKSWLKGLCGYFSASRRAQRRVWFAQSRQEQFKRLHYFKSEQLRTVQELTRKRMLKANNRKHLQSLSKVIRKDLQHIKGQVPAAKFKELANQHREYAKLQNIPALLELQHYIAGIDKLRPGK